MIIPESQVKLLYHVACTVGAVKNGKLISGLFELSTRAKSGGKGGYAFDIVENGSIREDGYLIQDAEPYWNIFSNESPGYWALSYEISLYLKFRLKVDSSNRYRVSIGDYAGYDPNSEPPTIESTTVAGLNGTSYDVVISANTGSYDWRKVGKLQDYAALVEVRSNGTINSVFSTPEPLRMGNIHFKNHISISAATVGTYKLGFAIGTYYQGDFNPQALLPCEGELEIAVSSYTTCVFIVEIKSGSYYAKARSSAERADGVSGKWSNTIRNTSLLKSSPICTLTSVTYTARNQSGSEKTKTRTTVSLGNDSPYGTYDFHEAALGANVGVSVDVDPEIEQFAGRVGGHIVITMKYS